MHRTHSRFAEDWLADYGCRFHAPTSEHCEATSLHTSDAIISLREARDTSVLSLLLAPLSSLLALRTGRSTAEALLDTVERAGVDGAVRCLLAGGSAGGDGADEKGRLGAEAFCVNGLCEPAALDAEERGRQYFIFASQSATVMHLFFISLS